MSRQYYYIVAGLPDILYDDKKIPLSLHDYRSYLSEQLSPGEMELIRTFFWRFDNENIINRLEGGTKPVHPLGNLDENKLDGLFDFVKEGSFEEAEKIAPAYLGRFIEAYKNEEPIFDGKRWDLQLSELYYDSITNTKNGFINSWYKFERDLNNFLTAFSCRNNEISIPNQLIGSGELNDKLTKSSARDFGITDELEYVEKILKVVEDSDIINQEKGLDQIKWEKLDADSFFHYFSLEKLFVFMIKLSIAERWMNLDKDTGLQLFEELLKNLGTSNKFSEEFSLK
jgi:hypothetical protein